MALAVVAAAGLIGAGFAVRGLTDDGTTSSSPPTTASTAQAALPAGPTPQVQTNGDEPVADVAKAISPAVVQIETQQGLGSGFIYDSSGLIMTNAHVVGTSSQVNVRLADGSTHTGQVVGVDTASDVAVVQISADGLPVARLSTDPVEVGEMAVALGSPFGLTQTVTAGIVSAVDRPVANQQGISVNMIQTDAPINPGNSGGPLANRSGEVIAMDSSIYSESGDNAGIGFAIPMSIAKPIADQIAAGQTVQHATLGIRGVPSTSQATASSSDGAQVAEVISGSPAAKAGIQAGDLITQIDGYSVPSFEELQARVGDYHPGDTVTVTLVRNGSTQTVQVTLGGSN